MNQPISDKSAATQISTTAGATSFAAKTIGLGLSLGPIGFARVLASLGAMAVIAGMETTASGQDLAVNSLTRPGVGSGTSLVSPSLDVKSLPQPVQALIQANKELRVQSLGKLVNTYATYVNGTLVPSLTRGGQVAEALALKQQADGILAGLAVKDVNKQYAAAQLPERLPGVPDQLWTGFTSRYEAEEMRLNQTFTAQLAKFKADQMASGKDPASILAAQQVEAAGVKAAFAVEVATPAVKADSVVAAAQPSSPTLAGNVASPIEADTGAALDKKTLAALVQGKTYEVELWPGKFELFKLGEKGALAVKRAKDGIVQAGEWKAEKGSVLLSDGRRLLISPSGNGGHLQFPDGVKKPLSESSRSVQ